jgi:Purple acid Phosphatase, N-terminal domain/Calcineurin-like phosphoesterase
MGHAHVHRPFVSRREFLRRTALAGAGAAAGPWFWRQLAYANAADAPVQHLHLTHGRDAATQMTASWMTTAPIKDPAVELAGHQFTARTAQYAGYPGYFHHARIDGLAPGTTYDYKVGAATARLTTAPRGPAPFIFTAFGDQGTDSGGQPPQQPSHNTELAQSFNPAFHVIVGDLAYANGNQAIWDDWFDMIEPMARTTPWMPVIGNHEIESQLDPGGATGSWGEWGYDPYRTRFDLPDNGHVDLANCFYSFRYAGVHFVCIDNNDVNEEITQNIGYTSGRQQAFVSAELAAARLDPDVDFIVVVMHQCAFSSSTKHGNDPGVQKTWFELFRQHSVDLVLQGHDHTYERSHTMDHDKVAGKGDPAGIQRTDAGTVYIVCGNGGGVQEPHQPTKPAWSAFRQAFKVGTLKIEVDPDAPGGMARMTLGEYWALDGSPIEEGIVLERPSRRAAAVSGAASARESASAAPTTTAAAPAPEVTLPATGGPAGVALVGVAAAATGLAVRSLAREEQR